MQIEAHSIRELTQLVQQERQRRCLSREQLAAACNVSQSFIGDAESNPGCCTLEKL